VGGYSLDAARHAGHQLDHVVRAVHHGRRQRSGGRAPHGGAVRDGRPCRPQRGRRGALFESEGPRGRESRSWKSWPEDVSIRLYGFDTPIRMGYGLKRIFGNVIM
jgi:hypothetical protein